MPHSTTQLTSDEISDLIYFSRTNDLPSLQETITTLSTSHACTPYIILSAAIDVDEEGLGSRSCLLHYPAANGNVEIVKYLLSLIDLDSSDPKSITDTSRFVPNGITASDHEALETTQAGTSTLRSKLINHQNVSGNTPLHWAGMNGHLEVVKELVKAGVDPEILNEAGRDAVVESEWSSREGAAECVVWMLRECKGLDRRVGEGMDGDGDGDAEGSGQSLLTTEEEQEEDIEEKQAGDEVDDGVGVTAAAENGRGVNNDGKQAST